MKERVTISLEKDTLAYLDAQKGQKGASRSEVIETLLQAVRQQACEAELADQARAFFAVEETEEERQERADWLRMSMETQARDD